MTGQLTFHLAEGASPPELRTNLVDVFLAEVIASPQTEIRVEIDREGRSAQSGDRNVRQFFHVLVTARRFQEYLDDMLAVFAACEVDAPHALWVSCDGRSYRIAIQGLDERPKMKLRIVKTSAPN